MLVLSPTSGTWLEFPLNLMVFYLYGQALLATGLMFVCGLATTLGITVRWNTAIRSESVRCGLVACGVKYVRLLATILGFVNYCNTAIRPESVRYVLMTCGHVFVCYLATTLSFVIRYDTTIKPKSVRYLLAVIRLLPIFRACLR